MSGGAKCLGNIIALPDQPHLNAFRPARPVRSRELFSVTWPALYVSEESTFASASGDVSDNGPRGAATTRALKNIKHANDSYLY
jgi:hypothetical protein